MDASQSPARIRTTDVKQQTLMDGRFQVRHATTLAVRTGIWLLDEEANANEKSMCPAARAG